jgi:uncharacterized protein (TIGR02145 family)
MKKIYLILLLIVAVLNLLAQNLQFTFVGTGASSLVDSVKVDNLTQGTSITIKGDEVLSLPFSVTEITPIQNLTDKILHIYPNPMNESSTIEFVAPSAGTGNISLFDITGKKIVESKANFQSGTNSFKISGLDQGIFLVRVLAPEYAYTGKLVCNNLTRSSTVLGLSETNSNQPKSLKLKSANKVETIQYNNGDIMLFTGVSGTYNTVIAITPTQSGVITFNFVPCTDADGNNYPVVQIGTQIWMAKNLKTTKYRNGDPVPLVTDNNQWGSLTTGAYCNFGNDISNSEIYGHLYNLVAGYDSRMIAPIGWHIPSDEEWNKLTTFLGGDNVAGGKLKESGTIHWSSPNTGATNATGFSGLPGGYRTSDGVFNSINTYGGWWHSSNFDSYSKSCSMFAINESTEQHTDVSRLGLSVRCIKDVDTLIQTESGINDSLLACYSKFREYIEFEYLFDGNYANSVQALSNSWNEIHDHTQNASNEKVSALWTSSYHLIYKLNLILSSAVNVGDEPTRNSIIAQAKTIRAYVYLNLLNWFGGVPINMAISESKIPRNTTAEVLGLVKQDATESVDYLPQRWIGNDNFRIPKSFAQGLLARAYLFEKNYNDALSVTLQIRNSALFMLSANTTNFMEGNPEIFWGFEETGNSEFNSFFTKGTYVPGIRYTETFLIASESSFNLQNSTVALQYTNILKNRRGDPTISTIDATKIMQQWNIELEFEGSMFCTLKRFDAALNTLQIKEYQLLLPIPQTAIINNPNLIQNTGY